MNTPQIPALAGMTPLGLSPSPVLIETGQVWEATRKHDLSWQADGTLSPRRVVVIETTERRVRVSDTSKPMRTWCDRRAFALGYWRLISGPKPLPSDTVN